MSPAPVDLTGRWRGFYEQMGQRHGIALDVAQRGAAIVGRMRDEDTLLMGAATVQGEDESGARQTLGEAETMTSLPEWSVVEGNVAGRSVTFEKRYQGVHTNTLRLPGHGEWSMRVPDHRVFYSGRIDATGDRLTGEWHIPPLAPGGVEARGGFELVREDGARTAGF